MTGIVFILGDGGVHLSNENLREDTLKTSLVIFAILLSVIFSNSSAEAACRRICWTKTNFVPQICMRCYNVGRNRVCSQYQCGSRRVYAGQQCICG